MVPPSVADGGHSTVNATRREPVFGVGSVLSPISEISNVDLAGSLVRGHPEPNLPVTSLTPRPSLQS